MPRVLVVDDEPDLRFLLRRLLESAGFTVDEAPDGVAAIEQMMAAQPDLVVTDGEMPRMNGGDLIQRIREGGDVEDVPIILWSVNPEKYKGADVAFAKPYGGGAIVERAARLIAERS